MYYKEQGDTSGAYADEIAATKRFNKHADLLNLYAVTGELGVPEDKIDDDEFFTMLPTLTTAILNADRKEEMDMASEELKARLTHVGQPLADELKGGAALLSSIMAAPLDDKERPTPDWVAYVGPTIRIISQLDVNGPTVQLGMESGALNPLYPKVASWLH